MRFVVDGRRVAAASFSGLQRTIYGFIFWRFYVLDNLHAGKFNLQLVKFIS